jgi:hypothetical protein
VFRRLGTGDDGATERQQGLLSYLVLASTRSYPAIIACARLLGVLDLSWVHPELVPTTRGSVAVDRSGTEIWMLILGYEFAI